MERFLQKLKLQLFINQPYCPPNLLSNSADDTFATHLTHVKANAYSNELYAVYYKQGSYEKLLNFYTWLSN